MLTIGVDDLERALRFYRDGLGLPTDGIVGADIEFGAVACHNVSSKGEVDAVMKQASAAGAVIVKPAQDTAGGGYAGYFLDPDRHLWEVVWNPQLLPAD